MSLNRYAKRIDKSQPDIVEALHKAGWDVWVISWPVDLLCWKAGHGFKVLECKTLYGKRNPKPITDKRQKEQIEFLKLTGAPIVCTPMEALLAVGEKVTL